MVKELEIELSEKTIDKKSIRIDKKLRERERERERAKVIENLDNREFWKKIDPEITYSI